MFNNKGEKIFFVGMLLVLISATSIISSQSAEAGVQINDVLIYESNEDGEDSIEYVKLICTEIDDTTNLGVINVVFDLYFSPNLTSWPSTPESTNEDYPIFNSSSIPGMDFFPGLLIEPGLSIGTLAAQIETELNLNREDTITVTSINNSAGIRIEVDDDINFEYMEVIYDNNGVLIWYETTIEGNEVIRIKLLYYNGIDRTNTTETDTNTETGTGTDTNSDTEEDPFSISGYSNYAFISVFAIFILAISKKRRNYSV